MVSTDHEPKNTIACRYLAWKCIYTIVAMVKVIDKNVIPLQSPVGENIVSQEEGLDCMWKIFLSAI